MFIFFLCMDFSLDEWIAKLGDNEFHARENASNFLAKKMDYNLYHQVKRVKTKDPEIANRLNQLANDYKNKVMSGLKLNLKGYGAFPQIDEGMPTDYSLGGPWKGWNRQKFIHHYLELANKRGLIGKYPIYINYRKATELWMQERIYYNFHEAIRECRNENEFKEKLKKDMDKVQEDLEMLIVGDKKYYLKHNYPNPFLETIEKK